MKKIADLKAELADLRAEASILKRRCDGDEASENDISDLGAAVDKHNELKAKIETLEARADIIRNAGAIVDAPALIPAAVITQMKDRAIDDPQKGFKSGREFFSAVLAADRGGRVDERLTPLAAVGSDEQRGSSNPDGGFLIPEGFSPDLLQGTSEGDPTLGLVTNIPMGSPTISLNARVDKDHSTSVTGGFRFYRRGETDAITTSKAKFEQVKLSASPLAGAAFATDELLSDSPISVAALISQGFNEEYADHMFGEKMNGTGVGELQGIMSTPSLITVAKEGSQTADTIVGNNIVKMRARVWGYGQAVWIANSDCYPQLCAAHISGTNGDIFLFHPGNGIDVPDTLLGRPIVFSEHAATVGDLGDLVCANWSQYLFGNYQAVEMASSMHVRFLNNENCFKITTRNDGKSWWSSALTPRNGATKSPFVTLAARA